MEGCIIEALISNSATILLVIAVICTLICVITEFTKEIGFLNRIPTDLQVLIVSILVNTVAFLSFMSYKNLEVKLIYIAAVFFISFVVAIICTKGWTYLISIFKRFYRSSLDEENTDDKEE